jgi:uncharacterized protein (TIGR03382 family)
LKRTQPVALVALLCSSLGWSSTAEAHRLDEYLQATRIDLSSDRIRLAIDLTPGVIVAPSVLEAIDTDRDQQISDIEADAYANHVMREMVLLQDGGFRPLTLAQRQFSSVAELTAGTGTIRLEALARAVDAPGPHQLVVRNGHRPDIGAYLVNALVPDSDDIVIGEQRRDSLQREIELHYSVGTVLTTSAGPTTISLVMLALTSLALLARRRPTVR